MILNNKRVAVIGAGPVGLTIARLLQQKGISVTVYERDKDKHSRIWGGTLDLHQGSGQLALKEAGLLDRYFALAIPMGRIIADKQCNVLYSVKPNYESPEINRNDLRMMLLESLHDETVVWDRKFTSLETHNGQWLLHFENKPDAIADVVIGANGGLSKVRQYVTDSEVELTGTYIIQGEISQPEINCPDFYNYCDNNILMTACNGINLVANPKNNGALTYNVTFKTLALKVFGHWHERYQQLFRSTPFFANLPARKLSLDKPWKKDRPLPITLIGDAAHVMPPFAGEGVNTGLVDALVLSANLTSGEFGTIEAAIPDYEQKMFMYATKAQLETSRNEADMHQPDFSFVKRFLS